MISIVNGIRWQAISVMVLPGLVWLNCCFRAWQFQHLTSEEEQEAQDRIRSETASKDNETDKSQQQAKKQHHHHHHNP
jgi:hypothetical protein